MAIITLKYVLYSIWLNFRNSKQPSKSLLTTVYPFIPSRQLRTFIHPLYIHSIKFIFLNVNTMHKHSKNGDDINQFSSVQLLSGVQLFASPWTAACEAFLSITNSWTLLNVVSIELVMPSNYLILCCPLLLPPLIFPSIRKFSSESVLHIGWPKNLSFSFSISPSNEYFRTDFL